MYSEFFLENLTQLLRNNKRYILKLKKKMPQRNASKSIWNTKINISFLVFFHFVKLLIIIIPSSIIRTDEQAYNREYQVFS